MHPLNVSHLVIGLLLLGIAGAWAADHAGWIDETRYVGPVLLVGAGLIGLAAFATRGLFRRSTEASNQGEHHE